MSAAAAKLHVAQPALSHAIRKLERTYGVSLLERHARGVRPTPEGAQVVAKARAIVAQADDLDAMTKRWTAAEDSEGGLGVLPMSLPIIEPLLASVRRQYPTIRVVLRQLDFTTQLAELRRGRIDVEIACPAPEHGEFAVIEVGRVERDVYLHADHALARESAVTVEQLRQET